MMGLTPRQREAVVFIGAHLKAHGIAPSYDEIGFAIGLRARSAVGKEVIALETAGYLRRIAGRRNAIELIETKDNHASDCNCLGCAHARYLAQLKLVQALQVSAKISDGIRLVGLRILSDIDRLDWKRPRVSKAAPGKKAAVFPMVAR